MKKLHVGDEPFDTTVDDALREFMERTTGRSDMCVECVLVSMYQWIIVNIEYNLSLLEAREGADEARDARDRVKRVEQDALVIVEQLRAGGYGPVAH